MFLATDALFTLNSSADQWTAVSTNDILVDAAESDNHGGDNASGVTGVCIVRDSASHKGSLSVFDDVDGLKGVTDQDEIDGSISEDGSAGESSDDDCQPLRFRCSDLLLGPQRNGHQKTQRNTGTHEHRNGGNKIIESYQHAAHLSAASHDSLSGAFLASCHLDGSCKLWNLATRRCIAKDICQECPRGGSGLALRRLDAGAGDTSLRFFYQTRDPLGTVTLHSLHRPCTPLLQIHTNSTAFCAMSPCHTGAKEGTTMGGEQNLVALPTEQHSVAVIRDLRCDPKGNPAWRVAVGNEYISTMYGSRRKYGMLTSLALCLQETTQRIVMGCGMENGSCLFYDLGAMGRGRGPWSIAPLLKGVEESDFHDVMTNEEISENDMRYVCSASLGKDPVLCLDLVSSSSFCKSLGGKSNRTGNVLGEENQREHEQYAPSLVAVGGCAGDADELSELPKQDQGTISTIKVKLASDSTGDSSESSTMKATVRAKTHTCSISSGGKVGVSICRFRPDGRIYAVGGWDHRLRLFGRTSSKPLAILRGHEKSVTALDWADNAALSGLLATGAYDGKICIWRAFPHSSIDSGKTQMS